MVERRNRSSLNVFERAGAFLDGAFYSLATPIGAFIMTLGGAFLGSYDHSKAWAVVDSSASFIAYLLTNPYAAFIVGFPLTVFGAKGVYDEKKQLTKENDQLRQENIKVKDLEAELEASQEDGQSLRSDIYRVHQDLVGTWLKGVSKQINLDSYSRVSIYYENRESFYLLSRYSINPKLAKVHKPKFGLNEGVISQAWQHGEHSEDNSPEFASDKDGYFEYMMQNYSYSREILESINMKSCRYFAVAITEAGDNIGVILFESERKDSFPNEVKIQIRDYCSDYQSHLCNFVKDGILYDKSIDSNKAPATVDNDADVLNMLGGLK